MRFKTLLEHENMQLKISRTTNANACLVNISHRTWSLSPDDLPLLHPWFLLCLSKFPNNFTNQPKVPIHYNLSHNKPNNKTTSKSCYMNNQSESLANKCEHPVENIFFWKKIFQNTHEKKLKLWGAKWKPKIC